MGGKPSDPDYYKKYYQKHRQHLIERSRECYAVLRLDKAFRRKEKLKRELRHFGILRVEIFKKTWGRCFDCGAKATVVHHLDGDGRSYESLGLTPGHSPERLMGFCRGCHLLRHRQELCAALKSKYAGRWAFHYDACIICNTTERRHESHGRCVRCCARIRWQEKARIKMKI